MMLDKIIEPGSLKREADGISIGLRLPWYRALPLSTIEIDQVRIDGIPIESERMTLAVDGSQWLVQDLQNITDRSWFVTDTARLSISGLDFKTASNHEVEVTISLYPPYIKGLRRATRWAREMEVQG